MPRARLLLWTDLEHTLLSQFLFQKRFWKSFSLMYILLKHKQALWCSKPYKRVPPPEAPRIHRTCSCEPQSRHHRAHIDVVCILQGSCFLGFLPAEQRLSCCTFVILSAPGTTGQHIHFPFNESTVFLLNIVYSEHKWKIFWSTQIKNKKLTLWSHIQTCNV